MTMPQALPANLTLRAPTLNDIEAITELVKLCEIADTGESDTSIDDLREMWAFIDLAHDAFAIVTPKGQMIGYTGVNAEGTGVMLDAHTCIHPEYRHYGLAAILLELAEQRARALIARADPPIPTVMRAWSFSHVQRAMLDQTGFSVITSQLRMDLFLQQAPPRPEPIAGIIVRPYLAGKEERAVHAVVQEAFRDINNQPLRTFEDWYETVLKRASFDPSMLYVAMDGEQMVGAVVCRTYPTEKEAYIGGMAVLRPWRRRGIARQILLSVFDAYYQRSIEHVLLDVHAENMPAQTLYRGLGMQVVMQVDDMRKELS